MTHDSLHSHGFLGPHPELHGSRKGYAAGCRCLPCRSAESCYQGMRMRARANGEGDPRGFVDATASRNHVAALMAAGLGRRQIARLAGVTRVTVRAISRGQPRVTPAIEARILAVKPILADGAHVNAFRAFDRIRALFKEGYTTEQLRSWLGFEPRRRYKRITAKHAAQAARVFRDRTAE